MNSIPDRRPNILTVCRSTASSGCSTNCRRVDPARAISSRIRFL
ncbi:MAG: hypothetical protein ABSB41_14455 [Anaerolineales bacterium]